MVKLFGLVALWVVFAVSVVAAWSHRFVPEAGAVRADLDGLVLLGDPPAGLTWNDGVLRMTATREERCSASFHIPGVDRAEFLHVRHHAAAEGIVVGEDPWDDGRLFIQWRTKDEVVGISRIHSARSTEDGGTRTMVIRSPGRDAVPVMVVENLGHAGTYEVRRLEWVAARERPLWKFGKWGFATACLVLLAATIAGTKKPARWRGWVAAGVWLWVAANYAFPGPWDVAYPFAVPFAFGEVAVMEPGSAAPGRVDATGVSAQMESLPPPRDIGLRLKLWLPWLRPLLHWVMLFAPALAMAWFVGAKRVFWLGWGLSLLIEAAQVLYGFGFGWDDVGDLIVNGVAISAAVWAHGRFAPLLHKRLPFPFPRPV